MWRMLLPIGNADETPVFWDMPSNMTVDNKGAKSISLRTTGNEKQRITVMLAVTADGGKLPPYVILKRKTMPKQNLPKGLVIRCQEKGWMTTELMMYWLAMVWNRRPGVLLCKRAMLVLDAFKGHLTLEVKKKITALKTDLVIIPGGMTSKLQVLDVVVNKPFKDQLRKQYSDWLLEGGHAFTPSGKIKKLSVSLICFKKCCVSNALDGSEDDVLWAESDERSDSDETNTGTGSSEVSSDIEKTGTEEDNTSPNGHQITQMSPRTPAGGNQVALGWRDQSTVTNDGRNKPFLFHHYCPNFTRGSLRGEYGPCGLVQLPRFLHESLSSVRPVYVIDVYKLTPSNGPKERSRRARHLTVASDNLSAIEFRPEYINPIKMPSNLSAVRSVPGRSFNTTRCRHTGYNEMETLGHVLGFCRKTELLRNNRHPKARTGTADVLKRRGWEVHEEIHCVSSLDSNRRADIVAIHMTQSKGIVLDPTMRFERDALQAQHVDEEKKSIYESCIPYLSEKYNIPTILLWGSSGAGGNVEERGPLPSGERLLSLNSTLTIAEKVSLSSIFSTSLRLKTVWVLFFISVKVFIGLS
ncbi:hypothetical protein ANN_13503 [Periplaneta americana]|uniref:DDE-1 domain-containing protein n=1 Tax=Periplaneta americana TaxID=6978 RepID=A0ABQ8TN33_PERAM|nr:hypothetical protein ANN_13503 [Periplaneta americana]